MSEKWGNGFGHFSAFFELWTVFWAVFRYRSGKRKKIKKDCSWYFFLFPKKKHLALIFGFLKCVFPKCTFSGPQLSWRGCYGIFLIRQKPMLRAGLKTTSLAVGDSTGSGWTWPRLEARLCKLYCWQGRHKNKSTFVKFENLASFLQDKIWYVISKTINVYQNLIYL